MSTLPRVIEVELPQWEKWNPRKDLKTSHWFRLQNTIFDDHQFFDFEHSEILFFIYLMSLASKKQTAKVQINVNHAVRIGRFSKEVILSSLDKLEQLQCVRRRNVDVTENHAPVTSCLPTEQNRTEQNVTKQNTTQHNTASGDVLKVEEIDSLLKEWAKTLKHWNISKDARMDEVQIARLYRQYGYEKSLLAIIGQRKEPSTKDFNPRDYISIARLSKPEHFDKCVNRGAQNEITEGTGFADLDALVLED